MQVVLNPYQWEFLTSKARFPGLVAGWGTGKTLVLIQRAMVLSQCYQDNLGLVVRKVFKDLADSTIKDFELYTGLKVPMSTRDVVIPGSKSRIMFRHLEELTGGATKQLIQNVNLGFVAMEQAEEFETSEQFHMLRGRLRRRLHPFEPYYESYAQRLDFLATSQKCVFCGSDDLVEGNDAFGLEIEPGKKDLTADPNLRGVTTLVRCRKCYGFWNRTADDRMTSFHDYLRYEEVRTGFVIANANGKNWVWRQWLADKRSHPEHYYGIQAQTFDNEHNLPADFVEDLRSMEQGTETEQRKYRRYVLNCHDEADLEGSYYLKLMEEARKEGRIGVGMGFDPDKSVATHTAWDLGMSDATAIWFFQKVGAEIRHVHYYENSGEPLEHYIRYVFDVGKRLGLHFGQHFWPHDGKKRDLATGKELRATATEMGLHITTLAREKRVTDGIERVRKMLPYATFHENECSGGIEALEHYQRRKNVSMSTESKGVYSDTPLHDWSSHCADCERYVSAAIRKLGGIMSKDRVRQLQEQYT